MEPVIEMSTLPLSIAQVDSAVYTEPAPLSAPIPESDAGTPVGLTAGQKKALAALTVRAGEVEAAEWALDQAKAACTAQIAAALASGIPAETVAAAAGVCACALDQPIENRTPTPQAS